MAKISPRDLFLLVLLLCVLVLIGWYFFFFQSQQQQIVTQQQTLDDRTQVLTTYQAAAAGLPALRARVVTLQAQSDSFVRALPERANLGGVLETIRQDVAAAGGTLTSLNVGQNGNAAAPQGVQPIGLTLQLSGTFEPTFQLVRSLETMNRFSTVSGLSMTLPAASSTDPLLNTTLNMTVYTFNATQAGLTGSGAAPQAPSAPPAAPATGAGGIR